MALNYTPVKIVRTLWIHRVRGCDFLVRGEHDELVKLAEALTGQAGNYYDDGVFYTASNGIQAQIKDDGFQPEPFFYYTIAYVEPNDAYMMTMKKIEPEEYFKELKKSFEDEGVEYPFKFKWPEGFEMIRQVEPYDFTTGNCQS